jgi:hypothetical protein
LNAQQSRDDIKISEKARAHVPLHRYPNKAIMKRKTVPESEAGRAHANGEPDAKKRALSIETVRSRFRDGLLDRDVLNQYKQAYAKSTP